MKKTWILVASRKGARLFEHQGERLGLVLEFENPRGRLKDSELTSDKPGKSYDQHGSRQHDYSPAQLPHEREAENFARELTGHLDKLRREDAVRRIVLVAEPKFLGILRGCLNSETAALVNDSVAKDLVDVPERDLPKHLEGTIRLFETSGV
jgi:protein required for attachment to host cells